MAENKKVSATATIKKLRAEKRELEMQLEKVRAEVADLIKEGDALDYQLDEVREQLKVVKEANNEIRETRDVAYRNYMTVLEELDRKTEEYQAIIRNLRHQNELLENRYNETLSISQENQRMNDRMMKWIKRDEFLLDFLVDYIKADAEEEDGE